MIDSWYWSDDSSYINISNILENPDAIAVIGSVSDTYLNLSVEKDGWSVGM